MTIVRAHANKGFKLNGYNGLFISSGCYGDVFRPPLPCQGVDPVFNNINYVGKVFEDKAEGEQQYKLERVLLEVDPDQLFSLPPVGACSIQPTKIEMAKLKKIAQVEEGTSDDNFRAERNYYTYQIVYPFGGYNFFNYMDVINRNSLDFSTFLNPAMYLMNRLGLLNDQSYFHFDIKNENILYNQDVGLLRLIDFQYLSSDMNEIIDSEIDRGAIKIVWANKRTKTQTREIENFNMTQSPEINMLNYFVNGTDEPSFFMYFDYVASNMNRKPRDLENWAKQFFEGKKIPVLEKTAFYRSVIALCDEYKSASGKKKGKIVKQIRKIYNDKSVICKQESFTYGLTMLTWFWVMYDNSKRTVECKNLMDEILGVICNKLMAFDVEKRITLTEGFLEILDILSSRYAGYFASWKNFINAITADKKSPDAETVKSVLKEAKVQPQSGEKQCPVMIETLEKKNTKKKGGGSSQKLVVIETNDNTDTVFKEEIQNMILNKQINDDFFSKQGAGPKPDIKGVHDERPKKKDKVKNILHIINMYKQNTIAERVFQKLNNLLRGERLEEVTRYSGDSNDNETTTNLSSLFNNLEPNKVLRGIIDDGSTNSAEVNFLNEIVARANRRDSSKSKGSKSKSAEKKRTATKSKSKSVENRGTKSKSKSAEKRGTATKSKSKSVEKVKRETTKGKTDRKRHDRKFRCPQTGKSSECLKDWKRCRFVTPKGTQPPYCRRRGICKLDKKKCGQAKSDCRWVIGEKTEYCDKK